jgi:hypothetical protein
MTETNETAKRVFVEALARSVDVSAAARAANVSRATVYRWRKEDSAFAERWDDRLAGSVDQVEDVAFAMATSGEHPTMTQFVLKSWRRDTYGEKLEHSGSLTLAGLREMLSGQAT